MRRRIVVNGVEYERVEDLPAEVRRMLQHELPPSFTKGSSAPGDEMPQGADFDLAPSLPEWMRVETVAAREARLRRARLLAGALLLMALVAAAAALWLYA